jgi:hypothetical protein
MGVCRTLLMWMDTDFLLHRDSIGARFIFMSDFNKKQTCHYTYLMTFHLHECGFWAPMFFIREVILKY